MRKDVKERRKRVRRKGRRETERSNESTGGREMVGGSEGRREDGGGTMRMQLQQTYYRCKISY